MKIANQQTDATSTKYNVLADSGELVSFKDQVINKSRASVKVPGFRPGKAPLEMIEKYLDPKKLQNDFLNQAINDLYLSSIDQLKLRVVNEPQISILKFVPFSTLEFSVNVEVITKVKLADYRQFNIKIEKLPVSKEQLDNTLNELLRRSAKYDLVSRAAKTGDQLLIDFIGSDFKTKTKLMQASGQDYKLTLGSNNFVAGFEDKLIGLKSGQKTSFDLTFPKDYHDPVFKSRKVNFEVTVREVYSVDLPAMDDKFAATIGPFKSVSELSSELNRQLSVENDNQAIRQLEDKILNKLAETTKVEIPSSLIDNEVANLEAEAKRSAVYSGQSWSEFLSSLGVDEQGYKKQLEPLAELRIKGGLAIGEIASNQGIDVSPVELESKLAQLKTQYTDPKMLEELDNPNNRREILMRLLSEKVLDHIKASLKTSKAPTNK